MATLELPSGHKVLIDDCDQSRVAGYRWRLEVSGYVVASDRGHTVLLHRLIMGAPPGLHVHHDNEDTLDNRRENLKVLLPSEHSRIPSVGGRRALAASIRQERGLPAPSHHFSVRLPVDLLDVLEQWAHEGNRTRTQEICRLVREEEKRHKGST
jgi:hypothetical protein